MNNSGCGTYKYGLYFTICIILCCSCSCVSSFASLFKLDSNNNECIPKMDINKIQSGKDVVKTVCTLTSDETADPTVGKSTCEAISWEPSTAPPAGVTDSLTQLGITLKEGQTLSEDFIANPCIWRKSFFDIITESWKADPILNTIR